MIATVSRWGNSLAIRIPKTALEGAHLREGDLVDVVAEDDGRLVVRRAAERRTLDELVAAITPENRHAAAFPGAIGNEVW